MIRIASFLMSLLLLSCGQGPKNSIEFRGSVGIRPANFGERVIIGKRWSGVDHAQGYHEVNFVRIEVLMVREECPSGSRWYVAGRPNADKMIFEVRCLCGEHKHLLFELNHKDREYMYVGRAQSFVPGQRARFVVAGDAVGFSGLEFIDAVEFEDEVISISDWKVLVGAAETQM